MARKSRKNVVAAEVVTTAITKYNAAAYVRLSSDARRKNTDSLETQQNIIENFISTTDDIRLVEVYSDNFATGTNFDRPAFKRMIADAESGKINCIIVKDLSRFGRNAVDAGYYLERLLPQLGVRFIAVTDDFDTINGDGGMIVPLKNVLAESYAIDISRKCCAVNRQNVLDGRFIGRLAPYGYIKDPNDCHHLVVDSETAPIVRMIYDKAAGDWSAGDIARMLNKSAIPSPGSHNHDKGYNKSEKLKGRSLWRINAVKEILADRVYIGDMVQGKTKKVNHKRIAVPQSEWVCVPNTHEPIISRELFERVQRDDRTYEFKPYTENIFKGKVFCARCGHPMHRNKQVRHDYYWFRCDSKWRYGSHVCTQVSVKESELKAEIMGILYRHAEVLLGSYVLLERDTDTATSDANTELRDINAQLENSGRMLKSLYISMVEELITPDEFVQMKAEYQSKIAALSARADALRHNVRTAKVIKSERYDFTDAVSAALSNDTLTEKIIGCLVDKILIKPDKSLEIHFKFADEMRVAA